MNIPECSLAEWEHMGQHIWSIFVDGWYLTERRTFESAVWTCLQVMNGIVAFNESKANTMAQQPTQRTGQTSNNRRSITTNQQPQPTRQQNGRQRIAELPTMQVEDAPLAKYNGRQRISEVAQSGPMPWLTSRIVEEIGEEVDFLIVFLTGQTREIQIRENTALSMAGGIQTIDENGNPDSEIQDVEFTGKAVLSVVETVANGNEWEGELIAHLRKHYASRTRWYWVLE